MKFGSATRRSIRFSIFVGVLAGCVFSGSGAFADTPLTVANFYLEISRSIAGYDSTIPTAPKTFTISGEIDMAEALANKVDSDSDGIGDSNFSIGQVVFSGEFRDTLIGSNGATLSNLSNTLFDTVSGRITNLSIDSSNVGVNGRGILANEILSTGVVDNVKVDGLLNYTNYSGSTGGIAGTNYGEIKNSTSLADIMSSTTANVGGIIGVNEGSVFNSNSSGNITSSADNYYYLQNVGGIAGTSSGTIEKSTSTSNVLGKTNVGGLVGYLSGEILNSSAEDGAQVGSNFTFDFRPPAYSYVGGLVGFATDTSWIFKSNSNATVTGSTNIGGLVGGGVVKIEKSSASGEVNGTESNIGGLVGQAETSSSIDDSYSSATVNGNSAASVGGLVGNLNGMIENSYSQGNVFGQTYVGGLAGNSSSTSDVRSSFAKGLVQGGDYSGGLIGDNEGFLSNSYSMGSVLGGSYVGGLVGRSSKDVNNSYVNSIGGVTGTSGGYLAGYVGGLAGYLSGNIKNSYALISGSVSGNRNFVGGLVGSIDGDIENTYAKVLGSVSSSGTYQAWDPYGLNIGGLTGFIDGDISNSFSEIGNDIYGAWAVGGLAGNVDGQINNSGSQVSGDVYTTNSGNGAAGLVGNISGKVLSSFAVVGGDVTGSTYVGGLAAITYGDIENSHARISGQIVGADSVGGIVGSIQGASIINSDVIVGSDVEGTGYVGALAGRFETDNSKKIQHSHAVVNGSVLRNSTIQNFLVGRIGTGKLTDSYFLINNMNEIQVTNSLRVSDLAAEVAASGTELTYTADYVWNVNQNPSLPSLLNVVSTSPSTSWAESGFCNQGFPYLIALTSFYENNCEDPTPPLVPTPTLDRPIRERVEREVREVTESRAPEKIEKSFGFKNETPLPRSAPISFVELTEKIDLAKVKAVEIAPTSNVKVVAKTGEALQISLKSESKEPVELWVKCPDGTWLLAGVITFNENGKAILPPLQFKNAGDYSLVLSKPSADSAKGSAPLNQTGSLLVAVR